MSIELYVYCSGDRRAPVADVQEMLEVAGWEVRFFDDFDTLRPMQDDTLRTAAAVGWEADAKHADAVEAALAGKDQAVLLDLFKKDRFAVVSVDLDESFSADPEDLEALEEAETDPKHVDTMRNAKSAYTLHTSATRNDASLELQEILWSAIAVAAYGLAHDPEDDSFEDNASDALEEDGDS
jgi:hypothetical protein